MKNETKVELKSGAIKAKQLREWINSVDDNEDIIIMIEIEGVGGNANYIEFTPALQGEEKENAIQDNDFWQNILWIGQE